MCSKWRRAVHLFVCFVLFFSFCQKGSLSMWLRLDMHVRTGPQHKSEWSEKFVVGGEGTERQD